MVSKEDLPDCPVATTVQLIGNKWKLLLLRNLLVAPCRFGEFRRSLPGISQKVLTENLKAMERDGIIVRIDYHEMPLRVEYRLTELGNSLKPIISAMGNWGSEYQARTSNEVDDAPRKEIVCGEAGK
jgi:DNA-binding HxlR family transcriptional regulator